MEGQSPVSGSSISSPWQLPGYLLTAFIQRLLEAKPIKITNIDTDVVPDFLKQEVSAFLYYFSGHFRMQPP